MEHTELNNIHDVYSTYRFLLENCQRCSANQKVLSHLVAVSEGNRGNHVSQDRQCRASMF